MDCLQLSNQDQSKALPPTREQLIAFINVLQIRLPSIDLPIVSPQKLPAI